MTTILEQIRDAEEERLHSPAWVNRRSVNLDAGWGVMSTTAMSVQRHRTYGLVRPVELSLKVPYGVPGHNYCLPYCPGEWDAKDLAGFNEGWIDEPGASMVREVNGALHYYAFLPRREVPESVVRLLRGAGRCAYLEG